jgi:ADP-ribose pyrophosphatase YjhB (NUDIX family)
MVDRPNAARPTARPLTLAVDVVLFTPRGNELAALLAPAGPAARPRERLLIPSDTLRADETLDVAAARIARDASGIVPSLLEQAGAIGGAKRQQDLASVAVTYFGLIPDVATVRKLGEWVPLSDTAGLIGRAREEVDLALATMRARVDQQPIAFRLLPAAFTLSELQGVYELLLGRRLHKASFRRALHASALVEPTDEWRSEGRGRPAQLFRYAPPRRRRQRRGIRFDLIA